MSGVSDLIDTTEMYLRTIFELEEEGVVPMRARIAERLGQSGPTVSQTVARMERDGLLTVEGDRHLELTRPGPALATRVMRKHRLAECLLVDVIGLEWEQVHAEACRWEHVMSEAVERRVLELLGHPTESPYGNPIPGLEELGEAGGATRSSTGLVTLPVRPGTGQAVVVRRIGEPIQTDDPLMYTLRRAGVQPGSVVRVTESAGGVLVGSGGESAELTAPGRLARLRDHALTGRRSRGRRAGRGSGVDTPEWAPPVGLPGRGGPVSCSALLRRSAEVAHVRTPSPAPYAQPVTLPTAGAGDPLLWALLGVLGVKSPPGGRTSPVRTRQLTS